MSFPASEFRARAQRAQERMAQRGLGALLLTAEADLRYFSGFLTRFWESPCRPWFLVLPASGDPVAVIPSIGEAAMRRTWISDIRVWSAPDPEDDGIGLLADALREAGGPVGIPSGAGTHARMPLAGLRRAEGICGGPFAEDGGIVAALRAVKSPAEIEAVAEACAIAGRGFDRVSEIAAAGVPLSRVFRDFQRLLLEEGADWVSYLAGGAGPEGYADVISPADDAPLREGDVLMLDTGAVRAGYFCDYDRNFAVGAPTPAQQGAHARLVDAVGAGMEAARPGAAACEVWSAMAAIVGEGEAVGRMGHGFGMQLTEGPSLSPKDRTVLQPGMVIALEPAIRTAPGMMMVHEENVALTDAAPRVLSPLAGPEIAQVPGG